MKILFISPPWSAVFGNYRSAAKVALAYLPLGLCYLAAVIKREGYTVKIVDAEIEGWSISDILCEIKQFNPHAIGITVATPVFHVVKDLADKSKKMFPSIPIFVGGAHCTAVLDQCLIESSAIDYSLYGECERSILDFLRFLDGQKKAKDVPGLIYRMSGEIKKNKSAGLINNLDFLPFPAREELQLDKYKWSVPKKGIVKFTSIMTSRGCPFNCVFCSAHTVFGKKVRNRSITAVLDEIQFLVEEHGIRHFVFIDDTLTLNHDRVRKLCSGIKERRLSITWEGWTRANTVNYNILKVMKEAGFVRISFGIESASKELSKLIRKEIPLEAYEKAYDAAKKLGIEGHGSVILGNPGETKKSAIKTLEFLKRLKNCDQAYINIATPYPATEFYDMAKTGKHGIKLLTDNFSEYRRYGNAVIEVNDLKREDLIKLQRKGFMMFYLTPARIWYNFKRAGFKAFFKNALAFVKSVIFLKRVKKT